MQENAGMEDMPIDIEEGEQSGLIRQMSLIIDQKLTGLKRSLITEQQNVNSKFEKKLKTSEKTFKSKSSKFQFDMNTGVREHLEEARDHLNSQTPSISKALESIEQGIATIDHRNKRIEIADISEFGWQTVEEYDQKAVADDSDDDRRLRRAEATVAKKRASSRRRGGRARNIPVRGAYSGDFYYGNNDFHFGFNQPFRGGRGRGYPRGASPDTICFGCWNRGHYKRDCPIILSQAPAHTVTSGATG